MLLRSNIICQKEKAGKLVRIPEFITFHQNALRLARMHRVYPECTAPRRLASVASCARTMACVCPKQGRVIFMSSVGKKYQGHAFKGAFFSAGECLILGFGRHFDLQNVRGWQV